MDCSSWPHRFSPRRRAEDRVVIGINGLQSKSCFPSSPTVKSFVVTRTVIDNRGASGGGESKAQPSPSFAPSSH